MCISRILFLFCSRRCLFITDCLCFLVLFLCHVFEHVLHKVGHCWNLLRLIGRTGTFGKKNPCHVKEFHLFRVRFKLVLTYTARYKMCTNNMIDWLSVAVWSGSQCSYQKCSTLCEVFRTFFLLHLFSCSHLLFITYQLRGA